MSAIFTATFRCVCVLVQVPRQAVFSGLVVKPVWHRQWKEPSVFTQRPSKQTPDLTHSSTSGERDRVGQGLSVKATHTCAHTHVCTLKKMTLLGQAKDDISITSPPFTGTFVSICSQKVHFRWLTGGLILDQETDQNQHTGVDLGNYWSVMFILLCGMKLL